MEAKPQRRWKNATLVPAQPGLTAANLPLLGSGKAENFLVFIWFHFKCFQRQRGRSTTVPRKLVHVGPGLPENEVISSFFIFCRLSPSTRVNRASAVSARGNTPRQGGRRAGWGGARREDPRCSAPASRGHPPPPRGRPKGELPGGSRRSGAARSANNNSK